MQITYILSQYPAQSETFIAREMQELVRQGDTITIARLRWSDTGEGLRVRDATVLPLQWNPVQWLLGIGWGLRNAPECLPPMIRDLFRSVPFSALWWRLLMLLLVSLSLARLLDGHPTTHLRAHFRDSESITAYWLGALLDLPYSVTVQTVKPPRFPSSLLRRVLKSASFCAATSQETKQMLEKRASQQNVVPLIHSGIQVPTLPSSSSTTRPLKILAVGRLVKKKGFDTLLDACHLLHHWLLPFQCTIIGDGPLRQSLLAQTHRLNLESRVVFRGACSNETVLRSMRQHNVLAMPSRSTEEGDRDGLPNVLIEAMAHGTPVVASNFAGIPELVKHGVTGLLVPPADPISLARVLRTTSNSPGHVSFMQTRAREYIEREFVLSREVGRLQTVIRETTEDVDSPHAASGTTSATSPRHRRSVKRPDG